MKLDEVDEEGIRAFFEEHWQGANAPEAGAACSGGVDGPGKVG